MFQSGSTSKWLRVHNPHSNTLSWSFTFGEFWSDLIRINSMSENVQDIRPRNSDSDYGKGLRPSSDVCGEPLGRVSSPLSPLLQPRVWDRQQVWVSCRGWQPIRGRFSLYWPIRGHSWVSSWHLSPGTMTTCVRCCRAHVSLTLTWPWPTWGGAGSRSLAPPSVPPGESWASVAMTGWHIPGEDTVTHSITACINNSES